MPSPLRSGKLRTISLVIVSIALVAVIVAVLVNMADSGSGKPAAAKPKPRPTPTLQHKPVLVVGPVDVQSAGPPATLTPPIRAAVLRSTQQYLNDAIVAPIATGRVDDAYLKVFDPGVKGPAAKKDRATLTETPAAAAVPPVNITALPVRVDAIADQTGKLALVTTTFDLNISKATADGRLRIRRHTELTFANEYGQWVVTAYRVNLRRALGPKVTTTTVHAGTTVAP